MTQIITDACVSCGICAGECPVGAISEGDGKYVIDADSRSEERRVGKECRSRWSPYH